MVAGNTRLCMSRRKQSSDRTYAFKPTVCTQPDEFPEHGIALIGQATELTKVRQDRPMPPEFSMSHARTIIASRAFVFIHIRVWRWTSVRNQYDGTGIIVGKRKKKKCLKNSSPVVTRWMFSGHARSREWGGGSKYFIIRTNKSNLYSFKCNS